MYVVKSKMINSLVWCILFSEKQQKKKCAENCLISQTFGKISSGFIFMLRLKNMWTGRKLKRK